MIKNNLDWKLKNVVSIYDEAPLWSAPFGRLLLENIPMRNKKVIVDLGFGTGFPLIELAQRFGPDSTIFGVDIWPAAIERAKEKITELEINNITIFEKRASEVKLYNESVDLVCSNLGVNNFDQRVEVIRKARKMLKSDGDFCLTTNDNSTFKELFEVFKRTLDQLELERGPLEKYLTQRQTAEEVVKEITSEGFELIQEKKDITCLRFTNAEAVFNHSLIRIAFKSSWEMLVEKENLDYFFKVAIELINEEIKVNGEFKMTIPILYFGFRKEY